LLAAGALALAWTDLAGAAVALPKVSLSATPIEKVEGNSGTSTVTFNATLDKAATSVVTATYATADGIATAADGDYVAKSGTVTFPAGSVSQPISVTVNGDTVLEDYQAFTVKLGTVSTNAAFGTKGQKIVILNDEKPKVTVAGGKVAEGAPVTFKPRLVQRYYQPVTVTTTTLDGSAVAPSDYTSTTRSVTFPAGNNAAVAVPVVTVADTRVESNETFSLQASGTALAAPAKGTGTITDPLLYSPTPAVAVGPLQFDDEFDGTALDSTTWGAFNNSNYGAGDSNDACLMGRNVGVANGLLQLTAKKETVQCGNNVNPDGSGSTYYWTSGFVTTSAKADGTQRYAFTHGYAEVRMKAPRGNPWWPAFWLVGDKNAPSWPAEGEIDVGELTGAYPDGVGADVHYAVNGQHTHIWPNAMNGATGVVGDDVGPSIPPLASGFTTSAFHTYGVYWSASVIRFYVDARAWTEFRKADYCSYNPATGARLACFPKATSDFWSRPHVIHLGLGIGGDSAVSNGYTGVGTPTGYSDGNLTAELPGVWQIDYVRQWKLP
jgi:hypothetical protein